MRIKKANEATPRMPPIPRRIARTSRMACQAPRPAVIATRSARTGLVLKMTSGIAQASIPPGGLSTKVENCPLSDAGIKRSAMVRARLTRKAPIACVRRSKRDADMRATRLPWVSQETRR
jgi:hypothetical protein